jgi:hypothetical protein
MPSKKTVAKKNVVVKARVKVNYGDLRKLIDSGKNAKEIMHSMGIKNPSTFKNALIKISMEDGKLYAPAGLFTREHKFVKCGKNGLHVSAKRIPSEFMGKKFTLSVNDDSLVFKMV